MRFVIGKLYYLTAFVWTLDLALCDQFLKYRIRLHQWFICPALWTFLNAWCAYFAYDSSTFFAWVWLKTDIVADQALILFVYVHINFRLLILGLLLLFLSIGYFLGFSIDVIVIVTWTLKFFPERLTESRVMWEVASSSMETSFSKSEKLADYSDVLLARLFPFLIYVLKSAFIAKFAVSSGIVPANPILHFVVCYNL